MGKDMKECQKKAEEKSKKKIVRGGINNVFNINNTLCNLLKYPKGSKKSWTQVTADIWKYISDNNLKDPNNKKMIIPDEALKKCLGIKKSSIIMLDLPSYLSNMFKNSKATDANDVGDVGDVKDVKDVKEDDVVEEAVNEVEEDVKKEIEKIVKVKKEKKEKKEKNKE